MIRTSREHLVFEVRLEEAEPQPWRRFTLPADSTFFDLHAAIQDACGWGDCHLWFFCDRDGDVVAGIPEDDPWCRPAEEDGADAKELRLQEWFGRRRKCWYLYDFGDDWRHEVRLLRREKLEKPQRRTLLDGEWQFPPEDCGGLPGFERCVGAVKTGRDPWEEEGFLEWLGDWRPDGLDLEAVRKSFVERSIVEL